MGAGQGGSTVSQTASLDPTVLAELQPELEVLRPLGSGDTANVYLAREPALQRLVAVKVLRPEVAADTVARQRFEREAQSAARISHANVTAIYRVGRLAGDVPYMVLEYIDGRTVSDILESGGTFDDTFARALLAAVAAALAAAHSRGIIHRDVRPGNVFVENRTARAVLGDFGIAALLESGSSSAARLTGVGVRLGDVRYMSPEQIRGEQLTEQSDVYAFGVLAFEVLTGRGPYDARSDAERMVAHLQGTPRALKELRPTVEPRVAALVERCLAKDPRHRPLAGDIASALTVPVTPVATVQEVAEPEGVVAQFIAELQRRRVSKVAIAYGTMAGVVLGFGDQIIQAFEMSSAAHRVLIAVILGGFPPALALSWIFDAGVGGIRRTRTAVPQTPRARIVMWGALALSVTLAGILAWLMLRRAA
jgi:tRNA A-37 threonylcarbamoyl transferase component Bud32